MIICAKHKFMTKSILTPFEQYVVTVVKKKRIEIGWSQKDLAYEIDTSVGFIGHVENPKMRHKYNLNHINDLAKAFKCSPKDFLPEKPL
jgi:ribosome-binding protein aMBF1 (putative translation factor)